VCSSVEDEPLSVILWVVVSDSQSILISTDVFFPEEGSMRLHLGLYLELDSITEWVSGVSP